MSVVSGSQTSDVYYDPYDFTIDTDPYPVWRRMRDESPLYFNEKYDFHALSRFEDVEPCLADWDTYRSGQGTVLEMIRANIEMPSGAILFEDPPLHDVHRGVMRRVFTPRKMDAIEPKVREFCRRSLDPLVERGRFDFIHDLGAQMPMRTIGYLLGIPEQDQVAIRERIDEGLRLEEGAEPVPADQRGGGDDLRRVHRLARGASVRRHHDRPAHRRVRRRDGHAAPPDPRRGRCATCSCWPARATRRPPGSSAGPARSWPRTPTSAASSPPIRR